MVMVKIWSFLVAAGCTWQRRLGKASIWEDVRASLWDSTIVQDFCVQRARCTGQVKSKAEGKTNQICGFSIKSWNLLYCGVEKSGLVEKLASTLGY